VPSEGSKALEASAGEFDLEGLAPPLSEIETSKLLKQLHALLIETDIQEGKLVCGNCGHAYVVKAGIANFLLPGHLGKKFSLVVVIHKPTTLTIVVRIVS
jgi:multifunctional methyltransferase subunit TRM112